MNQKQLKKGFLGWALGGGIYFMGGVPGSGFGGLGMAAIGAVLQCMEINGNSTNIRAAYKVATSIFILRNCWSSV